GWTIRLRRRRRRRDRHIQAGGDREPRGAAPVAAARRGGLGRRQARVSRALAYPRAALPTATVSAARDAPRRTGDCRRAASVRELVLACAPDRASGRADEPGHRGARVLDPGG